MVPFHCSSCVAGAIFRSLHHLRDDDSLCPPPPALPLHSLAPSLRMDHVFILLMSPTGLWVGFFYSLLVSATVESDKDVMAPQNVALKGNRSLWCCFPSLPFLKESGTGWRFYVFSFFSWETLMRGWPCHDNTMSWFCCVSSEVGRTSEQHGSDTESSELCQRGRGWWQALPSAPLAPHFPSVQKDLKYSNLWK